MSARKQQGGKKAATRSNQRKGKPRKSGQKPPTAADKAASKIVTALTLVPVTIFAQVLGHGNIKWKMHVLAMAGVLWAWSDKETLTRRWEHARGILTAWLPSAFVAVSYQAFIQVLASMTGRLLVVLMIHLHAMTLTANLQGRINGREVFAVDGSKVGVPWTDDNDQKLGHKSSPRKKKKAKKKQAQAARKQRRSKNSEAHQVLRPQILLTLFWHLGTGLPWCWQQGPVGSSERDMARQLLSQLPPKSIVVADAGFTGYEFWQDIIDAGHDFVIRVGANVRLLKKLGWQCRTHGDLVYLWPADQQKKHLSPIVVRLVAFETRCSVIWVATSILSRHQMSDRQIEKIYRDRWGIEGWFRSLKQTFGKRKMRSLTAEHAQVELDWAIVGLALIQAHGVQALVDEGDSPHALSEANAIDAVRTTVLQTDFQRQDLRRLCLRLREACVDDYVRTAPKAGRHVHRQKTYKPAGCPKVIPATKAQQRLAKEIQAAQMVV
jgi:hypothetical protein